MLRALWDRTTRRVAGTASAAGAAAQRGTEEAAAVAAALYERVSLARAAGTIPPGVVPLYRSLVLGSVAHFRDVVTAAPYHQQLQQVGWGSADAVAAAYLQVLAQRMWDLFRAFAGRPELATQAGSGFADFLAGFCHITGIPAPMVAATVNAAQELYERAPAEGAPGAAAGPPTPAASLTVVAPQTLDVLQTLTEGRYDVEHWRAAGAEQCAALVALAAARQDLLATALQQVALVSSESRDVP